MKKKCMTSREFNQNQKLAHELAQEGPVVITNRGRPEYVFLRWEDWEALTKVPRKGIVDFLASPETADIDFEVPRLEMGLRAVEW
ncbi:type II toxin-antitoxin system Phd/YefM family antitoxin [Sutterella sp.]|uniref:type II toxin-antitoxin system Phd/YefM family antitoxin n=1 Tax=Sutterella sp. TaxID=1981025 RepID=UPI0026E02E61|nr:type II toxin-antitoxin system Phd/YefM family antitoxin [Sutterella sp.]MDO5532568.1 type II toxin-antitoxin system Phd/YefM family antitoxin [Sutterella sp.]